MGANMAINFGFSSKNAHALLVKLGVDEGTLKDLEAAGWTPGLAKDAVTLSKPPLYFAKPITVDQMNKLYAGQLSIGALHGLKANAEELLKQAGVAHLKEKFPMAQASDLDDEPDELVGEGLGELTGPAGLPPQIDQSFGNKSFTGKAKAPDPAKIAEELAESKAVKAQVVAEKEKEANTWYPSVEPMKVASPAAPGKWAPVDVKKLKTLPVCKLREAKKMYQPVHGSSTGSRYFMVAGNADLRIAARFKGGTLSVRIEGDGWAKHAQSMATCGFDTHGDKSYASVHLAVGGDLVLANKTLGALIMGLGIPMETPYPNLSLIKEA